jgi:hypothetical protein
VQAVCIPWELFRKFTLPKNIVKSSSYRHVSGVFGIRTERALSLLQGVDGRALARSRRGALFSLGVAAPTDRQRFHACLEHAADHTLVDAIFDLASAAADYAVDMASLEEHLGLKRPGILKSTSRLIAAGVLLKTELAYYPNRRAVTVHVFVPPDELESSPVAARLTSEDPQLTMPIGEDLLRQAIQLRYDGLLDRKMPWKGERFVVFNLTALLRSGRTGSDTQYISVELRQGKRYCLAEARAAVGTMLAGVLDLRPLVVLLTLIRQHLLALNGRAAENLFRISLRDVCEAMGIDPSSSNVRAVHAQLKRWWQTTYWIVNDIYGMFDWAGQAAHLSKGITVLTQFDSVSWAGKEGITPELVQVKLYDSIYEALLEEDGALSVHDEILKDREPHPLRHKLYYWCRRVVQHHHQFREFLLDHIRAEITPKKPLSEFRRELREALADYAKAGENYRARIPGYLLNYVPNPERPKHDILAIAADPRDRIVGETSAYARRQLRQEQSPQ